MPPNTEPRFLATPFRQGTLFGVEANTALTGSGAIMEIADAGDNGGLLTHIDVIAQEATTESMLRFFVHDGTAWRLLGELATTALTPSGTVAAFADCWRPPNGEAVHLPPGAKVGAASHAGELHHAYPGGGTW